MTKPMTKTQLIDENIRLRAECARLEASLLAITERLEEASKPIENEFPNGEFPFDPPKRTPRPQTPRATRPVFEFDPTIAGDFVRASALARERNGSVRRARS